MDDLSIWVWGATAALASPSAHSSSVITGRVQQLHQHRTRTAAPIWGATTATASPSAHSSSISIERGQQLLYGAPLQLQHHRARTELPCPPRLPRCRVIAASACVVVPVMFRFEPTWSLRSAIEASASISVVVTASRVSSAAGLFSMTPAMVANVSRSVERR